MPPSGGFHKYLIMTENSKLSKDDLKWIKFNQKMAAMSGKKKLKKQDFIILTICKSKSTNLSEETIFLWQL